MSEIDWVSYDDSPPNVPGWYAIGVIYEVEEGICLGVAEWRDGEWTVPQRWIVIQSSEPFPDANAAREWAYKHHPEG